MAPVKFRQVCPHYIKGSSSGRGVTIQSALKDWYFYITTARYSHCLTLQIMVKAVIILYAANDVHTKVYDSPGILSMDQSQ